MEMLKLELLEKNIIDLQGEVNEDMFIYVRECIMRLATKDNPPISIKITSNGGNTRASFAIYDLLRLYPGEKTGTVIGAARSAAVTILQACDRRECMRGSLVLIHDNIFDVRISQIDDAKEWEKIMAEMRETQANLFSILEKRTKKSRGEIIALCKEDHDLLAEEALKFGLIDEIV
ncbi:MAG: Protease subunit of ATP-dependent Clp protease [Parcubacteria group bacterium Gr01-1014_13]|nr:MAG: Protease subunit of ATP-dependent Clp protease [Parcubacteria group bacterium Gr01-1014_13]